MSNRLLFFLLLCNPFGILSLTHLKAMEEKPKSLLLFIEKDSGLDQKNILDFCQDHKDLEALEICDCDTKPRLNNKIFTWILTQCKSLKTLVLYYCFNITYKAIENIKDFCPKLSFISIIGNKHITEDNITELQKKYTSLGILYKPEQI